MKEAFEKIIKLLEVQERQYHRRAKEHENINMTVQISDKFYGKACSYNHAISIVNQVAEEYSHVSTCYLQSPCEYQTKDIIVDVNSGWIPCSVDMPKELGKCIVKLKDGRSSEVIYDNIYKRFVLYGHEVIAWKPKPAGYCQEGELSQ